MPDSLLSQGWAQLEVDIADQADPDAEVLDRGKHAWEIWEQRVARWFGVETVQRVGQLGVEPGQLEHVHGR
jgi:hypothetical protein